MSNHEPSVAKAETLMKQRRIPEAIVLLEEHQRFRSKEELLTGVCARCAYACECRAGCTAIAYSGAIGCNPYCIRSRETREILAGVLEQ